MALVTPGAIPPSSKARRRLGGPLPHSWRAGAHALEGAAREGLAGLAAALSRCRRLWAGIAFVSRAEVEEQLADLASARLDAARWKAEAERYAARIDELEAEVATSQVVAMDLRARLVCLHGKLATTAATARYQSFASALGSRLN